MKLQRGWALRRADNVIRGCTLIVLWTTAEGAAESTYVVQRGDTLSSIATRFDIAPREIADHNELANPNRLDIGQRLAIPDGIPGAPRSYVVKKGDVLSAIAHRHQVSVQQLVSLNGLASPDQLRIGDELQIPAAAARPEPAQLPADLERELRRIKVRSRRWRNIVIHHSGTDQGTIRGLDRYHREERGMENGLAYHFVIGNGQGIEDGQIKISRRWRDQLDGGHMASAKLNRQCIGICLIGNFDRSTPTPRQMESLAALSDYLLKQCRLSKHRIKGHQQINTKPTRCPGTNFAMQELFRRLSS